MDSKAERQWMKTYNEDLARLSRPAADTAPPTGVDSGKKRMTIAEESRARDAARMGAVKTTPPPGSEERGDPVDSYDKMMQQSEERYRFNAVRTGAVKTTPPPTSVEEASFGAEMAAMPDPHGTPGLPRPLGPETQLAQAASDGAMERAQEKKAQAGHEARVYPDGQCYGTSPMETFRREFTEMAAAKLDAELTKGVQEDAVNSPAHYNEGDVECIDGIKAVLGEAGFQAHCHGTAIKYLWRAKHKKKFQEDICKAIWYSRMAVGDDPRKS